MKSIINSKVKQNIKELTEMYQDSVEKMSSDQESKHPRLSYVYGINDAINNSSFTIICSSSSQEFEDWITAFDVEDILIEMNNACSTSI